MGAPPSSECYSAPSTSASEDEVMELRVAALRRLAAHDKVPALHEIMQTYLTSGEVTVNLEPMGWERLFHYDIPVKIRLEIPAEEVHRVSEAGIVLAASLLSMIGQWQKCSVLELGCSLGFVGIALATAGARVVLTDSPDQMILASHSVAKNLKLLNGSACFAALDWAQPRARQLMGSPSIANAQVAVTVDPIGRRWSEEEFIDLLLALFGLDDDLPLCPSLERIIISHKHRPSLCINTYRPPSKGVRAAITDVDHCDSCTFRRRIQREGFDVEDLPAEDILNHPFIECWQITPLAE